ncbi:MAG: outer membrane protein assembly factor BamA, partial [Halocynthiibacter sp.]
MISVAVVPTDALARDYRFSRVNIEGNSRIEAGTILTYAGIKKGERVSDAKVNDAYQSLIGSGLFETVELTPRGNTLSIKVTEFPSINRINIEGNKRLKDDNLEALLVSKPRHIYSPSSAEADAARLTAAYRDAGRFEATVTPRIIRRANNRVDLVFEVTEASPIEIERLSFVGNRNYSDHRLRRVLASKQAGLLRAVIRADTFLADRIDYDKQLLRDFYLARGYIDFQTQSVNTDLTRKRDGFLLTFKVQEGQQFRFGDVSVSSDVSEADPEMFDAVTKIKTGTVYSPVLIEEAITRMERLAIKEGLQFVRVEPVVSRNDRDLTLDVELVLVRGPRVFVERIDIEGNNTTLDRVVRQRFDTVEGDPFNPREIRDAASRIRALGYFANADVNTKEGSSPSQVVVDVDVEEKPTGSLSFGASFGSDDGFGFSANVKEQNLLGRGQYLSASVNTSKNSEDLSFEFREPHLLGRDLQLGISAGYRVVDHSDVSYDTRRIHLKPSLSFPIGEYSRLRVSAGVSNDKISKIDAGSSAILKAEAGDETRGLIGYDYSYDTRKTGLDPRKGYFASFGQELSTGDGASILKTTFEIGTEFKTRNEDLSFRAKLFGGMLNSTGGSSRIIDRFQASTGIVRGFQYGGFGPRDLGATNKDALGGNMYIAARFEMGFPIGLPEEYG